MPIVRYLHHGPGQSGSCTRLLRQPPMWHSGCNRKSCFLRIPWLSVIRDSINTTTWSLAWSVCRSLSEMSDFDDIYGDLPTHSGSSASAGLEFVCGTNFPSTVSLSMTSSSSTLPDCVSLLLFSLLLFLKKKSTMPQTRTKPTKPPTIPPAIVPVLFTEVEL
jgi:hypothetical protein